MYKFEPRLTKPEGRNLYYIQKASGGYSPCDFGNNKKGQRDKILNVLPNCVGWVTGRFNELGEYGFIKYAPKGDAQYFVNEADRLGLKVRMYPTLGGIMVWAGGSGRGHVAIVEQILSNQKIVTSDSEWNGESFATYTRINTDGNWRVGCYWMNSKYKFIGCIVNPVVEAKMYEQFKEFMERYEAERASLPASAWAEPALKEAREKGVMVGDENGNQKPKSYLTREEAAVMLMKL